MDEDNLSRAIMIGVTTFIGIMTVTAIIIFFNSSLDIVRNVGSGKDFSDVYRSDIESTLLMNGTGNYIKGTNVINLLSFYQEDINITISVQNIKYIGESGNIQVYDNITMTSNDLNLRKSSYNTASRYIMDNQDFTINIQEGNKEIGEKTITIKGV